MALKDEIERIIAARREQLETGDRQTRDFYKRQEERFQPLRAVLAELIESVEPAYLKANLWPGAASIEVGRAREKKYFQWDMRWKIEPESSFSFSKEQGGSAQREEPGFRVEEMEDYRNLPDPEISEKTLSFPDEQAVAEYLLAKIAEKVAFYRHLDEMRRRSE